MNDFQELTENGSKKPRSTSLFLVWTARAFPSSSTLRGKMLTNGRPVDVNGAHVWTFRDGLISRLREYSDTAAWEAGFQK
jgi:ketosteroid isomerase-like protein